MAGPLIDIITSADPKIRNQPLDAFWRLVLVGTGEIAMIRLDWRSCREMKTSIVFFIRERDKARAGKSKQDEK